MILHDVSLFLDPFITFPVIIDMDCGFECSGDAKCLAHGSNEQCPNCMSSFSLPR